MDQRAPSLLIRTVFGLCLCLALAGALHAQCTTTSASICVTVTGTLGPLISGTDPLGLNGQSFTAVTDIPATGVTIPAGATMATYNGLTVTITASGITLPACTSAQAVVIINDPMHLGGDSFTLNNCAPIPGSTFTATAVLPPGTMVSPIPIAFSGSLIQGTASQPQGSTGTYSLGTSGPSTLGISGSGTGACTSCSTLSTTPSTLTFSAAAGGPPPASQSVLVNVASGGNVNYTTVVSTTSGGNWLSVSPVGGLTGTSFNVTATTGSLAAGTYNGTIKIYGAATNSPLSVPVTFNVTTAAFTLNASPTSLTFASVNGSSPPTQSLSVTTSPTMSVPFSASATSTGNWLSVSPTSGTTGSTMLSVSENPSGLAAGTYSGTITLTATGASNSPLAVTVTFNVTTVTPSPSSLNFIYTTGGMVPPPQTLNVNSSGPSVTYTAMASTTSGGSWLAVSPGTGTTNATPQSVSVTPGTLTAGTYTGAITITPAGGAPLSVPVAFTISSTPALQVSPNSLTFSMVTMGSLPSSQMLSVSVSSGPAVTFTTSVNTTSGGSWLSATPSSGTTPGTVTVSILANSLATGTYSGSVTITPSGGSSLQPVVIPVTLMVQATAMLTVVPSTLSFSYAGTLPPAQPLTVSTNGTTASFTATPSTTSGGNWLTVMPTSGSASGTSPAALMVSLNSSVVSGLATGSYSGSISVAATGFPTQTVTVSLTVSKPQATILVSGNRSFSLANTAGVTTSTLNLSVSDGSAKPFTAAIGSTATWLSVSPTSGTTPAKLTLTVNPSGLVPGTYASSLVITVAGTATGTLNVPVTLSITGSNLTVSPTTLTFSYQPGQALPPPQTLMLSPTTGTTSVPIAKVFANVQWLSVTQTSTAPGTVQVSLAPGLLQPGTYQGEVYAQGLGSPSPSLAVAVTATINAEPMMTVTPTSLTFNYSTSGALPAPASLSVASNGVPLDIMVGLLPGWLTATPVRGTTPATITVMPNVTGLADGTYTFMMPVAVYGSTGNPVLVAVTLNVTGPASPTAEPSTLTFTSPVDGPAAPALQTISIGSTGKPLNYTATANAVWLKVKSASGATPNALTVSANAVGLEEGTYTGSINISPAAAPGSASAQPIRVMVTLKVGSGVGTPKIIQVTNAASYAAGSVAPGMIVAIFGTSLGAQTGVAASAPPAGMPFATTLGETEVTFDGKPAPLLYASSGQVNVVVPFEVGSSGVATTSMVVSYNGNASTATTLQVASASPGIFTANGQGTGAAAVINEDGSSNSASHPAPAGSTVSLFGTGGGLTSVPSADGELTPSAGSMALPVTATVGGQPATVQYAGPAPDLIAGVMQINVVIPAGTPSGPANVVITVGKAQSQTVTVAVK